MTFNEYQKQASALGDYPDIHVLTKGSNEDGNESEDECIDANYIYPALGLVGEAGEVAEKIKKLVRNDKGHVSEEKRQEIKKELGDVQWYLQQLATEFNFTLEEVAQGNLDKLNDRKERGVIKSEGDNR